MLSESNLPILTKFMSRRDALNLICKSLLYTATPSVLLRCDSYYPNWRGFNFPRIARFSGHLFLADIGFKIFKDSMYYILDHLDVEEKNIDHAFRIFTYTYNLANLALTVSNPHISVATKITLVGIDALLSQLRVKNMQKAIALPNGEDYFVHLIAPAGRLNIRRSALCYKIINKEPKELINRELYAIPNKINYFTQVVGARRNTVVYHRWIKNGKTTDLIRLNVNSQSWRTWSNKVNLAPGVWKVIAETRFGEMLDVEEFSILY
jgi:hypothetical protein